GPPGEANPCPPCVVHPALREGGNHGEGTHPPRVRRRPAGWHLREVKAAQAALLKVRGAFRPGERPLPCLRRGMGVVVRLRVPRNRTLAGPVSEVGPDRNTAEYGTGHHPPARPLRGSGRPSATGSSPPPPGW